MYVQLEEINVRSDNGVIKGKEKSGKTIKIPESLQVTVTDEGDKITITYSTVIYS